ncbi:unnamed protein product, partial [marine sediment metagenome]
ATKYKCPRCGGENTIDYGETFECAKCLLEFYKEDIEAYEKSNILAISELSGFNFMGWIAKWNF